MTTRSDTEGLLREALDAAATWLEVEANHPRQDPVPAMRRQATDLRAALATPPDTDPSGLDVEAAWEALANDLWHSVPDVLARHRPIIEAAIRAEYKDEVYQDVLPMAVESAHEAAIQESRAGGGLTELDAEIARRQAPSYEWAPRADMHGRGGIGQAMQRGELTGLLIAQHLVQESRARGGLDENEAAELREALRICEEGHFA